MSESSYHPGHRAEDAVAYCSYFPARFTLFVTALLTTVTSFREEGKGTPVRFTSLYRLRVRPVEQEIDT